MITLLLHMNAAHEKVGEGVDPSEFVALFVAGMAIVAAVAALIFTRGRPPI